MGENLAAWYALAFFSGLSHAELHDALEAWCPDAAHDPADILEKGPEEWREAGLNDTLCQALHQAKEKQGAAERALKPAALAGMGVLTSRSADYPRLLAATLGRGRPPLLFCAGDEALLSRPGVAMIGSRRALRPALQFTRAAARIFGSSGLCVVSGFAEGVDRCASGAALDAGGSTILVLAQGLLTFEGHTTALGRGIDEGRIAALSAFAPAAEWSTPQAMARNAMITALARDVVVGQAGTSGGAWEAARMGLHQGRRVWVPRLRDGEELGHAALARLGAHTVSWPGPKFELWARQTVKTVLEEHSEHGGAVAWTEERALRLLREGEPAAIHDATGLTGALLVRIVEGRRAAALTKIDDLQGIRGLGPGAVEEVRRAFGLHRPAPRAEELSLFPDLDEVIALQARRQAAADPTPRTKRLAHEDEEPLYPTDED